MTCNIILCLSLNSVSSLPVGGKNPDEDFTHLPVEDDTPHKTKHQLWVPVHNVVAADVHQFNLQ